MFGRKLSWGTIIQTERSLFRVKRNNRFAALSLSLSDNRGRKLLCKSMRWKKKGTEGFTEAVSMEIKEREAVIQLSLTHYNKSSYVQWNWVTVAIKQLDSQFIFLSLIHSSLPAVKCTGLFEGSFCPVINWLGAAHIHSVWAGCHSLSRPNRPL